eukprot:scaffold7935_cov417-Prasinococcus_capsulatus_cf.AAC.3
MMKYSSIKTVPNGRMPAPTISPIALKRCSGIWRGIWLVLTGYSTGAKQEAMYPPICRSRRACDGQQSIVYMRQAGRGIIPM